MKWNISTLEELEDYIWRCTACGTCKVAYDYGTPPNAGNFLRGRNSVLKALWPPREKSLLPEAS